MDLVSLKTMNASHGSLDERSVPEDSQSKQGEGSVQITGNNQGKVREFIQFSGGRDEVLSKDVRDQLRLDISNNKEGIRERLQNLTSEEVFSVFDIDDSGLISYEEFRRLLPFLGIYMNDAKAYRFFRLCDMDDSGQIDVDEFKVILFLCDPTSGNQVGYVPKKFVSPLDAFELFDEDQSHDMDEDEFAYAMEYLGLKLSDGTIEKLFRECEGVGNRILYQDFREIFVSICDVKAELEQRGVDVSLFTKKSKLKSLLKAAIIEEELKETHAMAEASKYKTWMSAVRDKRVILERAKYRSDYELRHALDQAGQVYVFGEGSSRQFVGDPSSQLHSRHYSYSHYDKILELWRNRVNPKQIIDRLAVLRKTDEQERRREFERRKRRDEDVDEDLYTDFCILDPYIEAKNSLFRNLNVAVNTAGLHGRRIVKTTASESVIFALSDAGEIFAWGGRDFTWHEIQPDATNQSKWRGDTTPRSQLLLGTTDKELPSLAENLPSDLHDGPMYLASNEDRKAEAIKVVTKYYNVYEPPPDYETRMIFLEKTLLGRVSYDDIKFSLKCRGKNINNRTKVELTMLFFEDISLERKLLGEKAHTAIRELEQQIISLRKRKKDKLANKVLTRLEVMWRPLLAVQNEYVQFQQEQEKMVGQSHAEKMENLYSLFRENIDKGRSNQLENEQFRLQTLPLSGITPRGRILATPRSNARITQVAAGSMHACIVQESGALYTWGVAISGRLGKAKVGNKDAVQPVLVPINELGRDCPVQMVSCGYSHTGAITSEGNLYMWGSANTGKLGIGPRVRDMECFVETPSRVLLGKTAAQVKQISCGYTHTAVLTESGQMWVFGCGDGGRLGLGPRFATIYEPTLVASLTHEKLASVSCGNCSTIVSTEIVIELFYDEGVQRIKRSGGHVYVAGSSNVLGKDYDTFTLMKSIETIPIRHVSAGYRHSALISADGELFCWGSNVGGCCGFDPSIAFVQQPQIVKAMYFQSENLALGATASQSSTFHDRYASYAIDGQRSGHGLQQCSCTQEESHAWIEIDLGFVAIIDEIWIWNRTDQPKADHLSGESQAPSLPKDFFTSRLFPMWVMVGRKEFEKALNLPSYQKNLSTAVGKKLFEENKRVSKWQCRNIEGRYVRVQLQEYNYLNVAQIEVYGRPKVSPGVGRVGHVTAGRDVTIAVVPPTEAIADIERSYRRAVYCDRLNGEILRQLDTYMSTYDKFGYLIDVDVNSWSASSLKASLSKDRGLPCLICRPGNACEICKMYSRYGHELSVLNETQAGQESVESGQQNGSGRMTRRRLGSICEFLLSGVATQQDDPHVENIKRNVMPQTKVSEQPDWFKSMSTTLSSWLKLKSGQKQSLDDADSTK